MLDNLQFLKIFKNIKKSIEYILNKKIIYFNISDYLKENNIYFLKIELDDDIFVHVKTILYNNFYELDSIIYPRSYKHKLITW